MEFKEGDEVTDPRLAAIPDSHGHAKGEHKPFIEERPIPYTARMLFLWFFHACRRGSPRFMMVADHMNYLTFEDPAAVNLVRRALKLAQAGDLYGAAETAGVEVGHAQVVSEGLRRGMRYSIGAEVDNDPRSRPDAQNIVDAMRPDGMVRSVHFLPITHPTHGENWMWAFDNPEFKEYFEVVGVEAVWELYMTTLLEAIDKLPGHIVGHFYVPAVFGHWPDDAALEAYEDKLVDACAERGMAIELNSRYLYKHFRDDEAQLEKFRAVHLRLMRKAVAKGVGIAIGSDAHSPKDQGRAFEAVLALLDEAEVNEISFPIGGRLARVALRATEEFMKQFAPPEPEPLPPPPQEPSQVAAPTGSLKVAAKPKKARPSRAKVATAPMDPAANAAPIAADPTPNDAEAKAEPEGEAAAATVRVKPTKKTKAPAQSHDGSAVPAAVSSVIASVLDTIKKVLPKATKAVRREPEKTASKNAPPKKKSVSASKKSAPPAKKTTAVAKKAPARAKKAAAKPVPKKSAPVAKKSAAGTKKSVPAKKSTVKKSVKSAVKKSAKKQPPKKAAPSKKAMPKKSGGSKKQAKKVAAKTAKRPVAKKAPAKKSARRARR